MLQWKRSRSVFILLSVIFSATVETVSFSVYIILGYIQLQWTRSRSVFILFSVIFSYSGHGLVQCLYYSRLYSVTVDTVSFSVYIILGYIQLQWTRSRSVFILFSVIFSYSGHGLVQCLYYYRLYSVTVETVSFSAVLGALKRAVGVSLQRRV